MQGHANCVRFARKLRILFMLLGVGVEREAGDAMGT